MKDAMRYAPSAMPFFFIKYAMRYALRGMLILLVLMLFPVVAGAQGLLQGVSGFFDFNFTTSSTKSTDSSGNTVKTDSINFNPRFSLAINTEIFPNLKLMAGGLVEANISDTSVNNVDTRSTATRFRPYINLTLSSPPYTFGVGYTRREEDTKTAGIPGTGTVNEEYNAMIAWKPDGFPSMDLLIVRKNTYDKEHISTDITTDSVLLGLKYIYKNLDVRYQANYDDQTLKLVGLETKDLTQTGRITYSDSFFDRRVSFNTSYNISRQDVTTTSAGKGEVSFQIFPFAGLSIISDIPTLGTLLPNPSLVDGNLTASAGIDIGLPPIGGDTKRRNFGLDFLNVTEVNNLLVWVDRELPSGIANSFSWDVYISSDNLNWSLYRTISSAPFGQFQNSFELDFPNAKTRYIKVVTKPLSPTVIDASKFPNIFITELQAFLKTPAQDVKRKTHNTSQLFNVDAKTRILNTPSLYYDFSYFYSRNDPSGVSQYTLSNGLTVNHRFNQVFSGTARFAREDISQQSEKETDYVYNAALTAIPLRTLNHTLVFSGRIGDISGRSFYTDTLFLNNTAKLYEGIDVNLSGGLDFAKRETGEKSFGTTLNFGANIVPHRTLTLTLNYSDTTSDQSGGGKPSTSSFTRRGDLSVSFNPLRTLYLFGSWSIVSQTDAKRSILQNYAASWSPFPYGNLQFNIGYSESLRSEDKARERTFGPSLRWKITNRSTLDVSYQMVKSESVSQKSDSNAFGSRLQIFF